MDVRWTPNARADLHAIHDYIAQDSPQNALNFIDQLIQRADQKQFDIVSVMHGSRLLRDIPGLPAL